MLDEDGKGKFRATNLSILYNTYMVTKYFPMNADISLCLKEKQDLVEKGIEQFT